MSKRVPLCMFSKAKRTTYSSRYGEHDGLTYERLSDCPLHLTAAEGRKCPCKRRHAAGEISDGDAYVDVVVSLCTYPLLRDGERIKYPEALAESVRRRLKGG